MDFCISKNEENNENNWNITPLSGVLEGQIVAVAEGINLQVCKFSGKTVLGTIKALWGATVLIEDVYSDMETLRGLHLGGCFDTNVTERLTMDYDGLLDRTNKVMSGAKKVLAIGGQIYAKGAK